MLRAQFVGQRSLRGLTLLIRQAPVGHDLQLLYASIWGIDEFIMPADEDVCRSQTLTKYFTQSAWP